VLTIAVAALAVFAAFVSGLPLVARFLVAAVVVIAATVSLRRPHRHRLRLPGEGPAMLDGVSGMLVGRAVTPLFVAVEVVASSGQRRRALMFRDELDADGFRALLAALRHG
jgi:hypothetical protein